MKALLGFVLVLITLGAWAQTTVVPTPPPTTPDGNGKSVLLGLFNTEATSLTLAAYPSYAPELKINGKSKPFGFGAAVLYPVTDYGFVGGRLDYLGGDFWNPSVTAGLQYSKSVLGHQVTGFALGGALFPLSGAGKQDGSVGTVGGGGVNLDVWHSVNGKSSLGAFGAAEYWSNFGCMVYHAGALLNYKF